MNKKQKLINQKKKRIVIITACILALILIFAIISLATFGFEKIKERLVAKETNILYYNEEDKQNDEEENNVIVVGIDEKNENNENVNNENTETNNTKVETKPETPKKQEIPYYIKVNNTANVVTVYKKDSNGNYTVPVKAMICSIGDATPEKGVFTMSDKYTWRLLQGDVYGQYACRITGHILFHSVPYQKQDKSTLEWWEYDKLGTKASLGCIRLKVEDAKWIYDNCVSGTKVEFYNDSNPGPLGKPTAKKISGDEEVRNWDPTDPDKKNPWTDYLKRKKTEAKDTSTKPVNNVNENKTTDNNNKIENENIANENTVKEDTNNKVKDNKIEN